MDNDGQDLVYATPSGIAETDGISEIQGLDIDESTPSPEDAWRFLSSSVTVMASEIVVAKMADYKQELPTAVAAEVEAKMNSLVSPALESVREECTAIRRGFDDKLAYELDDLQRQIGKMDARCDTLQAENRSTTLLYQRMQKELDKQSASITDLKVLCHGSAQDGPPTNPKHGQELPKPTIDREEMISMMVDRVEPSVNDLFESAKKELSTTLLRVKHEAKLKEQESTQTINKLQSRVDQLEATVSGISHDIDIISGDQLNIMERMDSDLGAASSALMNDGVEPALSQRMDSALGAALFAPVNDDVEPAVSPGWFHDLTRLLFGLINRVLTTHILLSLESSKSQNFWLMELSDNPVSREPQPALSAIQLQRARLSAIVTRLMMPVRSFATLISRLITLVFMSSSVWGANTLPGYAILLYRSKQSKGWRRFLRATLSQTVAVAWEYNFIRDTINICTLLLVSSILDVLTNGQDELADFQKIPSPRYRRKSQTF